MHIRKTKIKKCMNLCLGCINLGYMNLCLGYFWGLHYFKNVSKTDWKRKLQG